GLGANTVALIPSPKPAQLGLQFGNPRSQRAHTDMRICVYLPQPFQLRLCNDQLTLKRSGSVEHGLALFFYVDSAHLACELAEFLLGVLQILIDLRKAFLKENAFAPRGRCAEVRNELIELIGKRPGHVRSALRITVRDAYSDHLVLAINRKSRIAG